MSTRSPAWTMPSESVYGQNFLNCPFLRRSLKLFWLYLIHDPLRFAILGVIEDLHQASCDFPTGAFCCGVVLASFKLVLTCKQ